MSSRILFIVILAVAAFLRFFNLGSFAPNGDEKMTLLVTHGIAIGGYNQPELRNQEVFTSKDFWKEKSLEDHYQALARAEFGTHYLYNSLLKYWIKAFGQHEWTLRLLSVLFNLLTIVLVYWFCVEFLKSPKTGLWTTFLLAIDPLFISQSHFFRSYTLSFLLIFIGTIAFCELLNAQKKKKVIKWGIIYGLVAGMAMLNHYLNFIVFISQALVALFFLRKPKNWLALSLAGVFTILVMVFWLTNGGGQWSMQFLKDKNELHLALASAPQGQNPMAGIVDISTLKNVYKKTTTIFFDSSALSYGLYSFRIGLIQIGFFLFSTALFYFFYIGKRLNSQKLSYVYILILLLIGIFFQEGIEIISFLYAGFLVFLVYKFLRSGISSEIKLLLVITTLAPLFYMVFNAFSSGHTTALAHRYVGVAIPFLAMIFGVGLKEVFAEKKPLLKYGLLVIIGVWLISKSEVVEKILKDESPIYTFRVTARAENPYRLAAQKVTENYEEGDTLLIPSYSENIYSGFAAKQSGKSILDAQNLNVYFSKDVEYVQRIIENERNLLILKKANGDSVEIFNFEDDKYRY